LAAMLCEWLSKPEVFQPLYTIFVQGDAGTRRAVREAERLVAAGVKELLVISQRRFRQRAAQIPDGRLQPGAFSITAIWKRL
jgi:hypothetical protein